MMVMTSLVPPTILGHGLGGYTCFCFLDAWYSNDALCAAEVDDCLALVPANVPALRRGGHDRHSLSQSSGDGCLRKHRRVRVWSRFLQECWRHECYLWGPLMGYNCTCNSGYSFRKRCL
jgi:hypothetical protein